MALVTPFQFWIILGEFLRKQRQSLHFEIRLFDILRFVISAGCLLQSKEERLTGTCERRTVASPDLVDTPKFKAALR